MNLRRLNFRIIAVLAVAFALPTVAGASDPPPTAATLAATIPAPGQAMLNGSVNANGYTTLVTFEYGPTMSYGTSTNAVPSNVGGSSPVAVGKSLTGLNTTTTYHYRVKAVSSAGTTYGQDVAFTPLAGAPQATTTAATGVSSSGGTMTALVNAAGTTTNVSFQYGPTTSYGTTIGGVPKDVTGTGDTVVTRSLSGMPSATTLHYRVVATNSVSTTYGTDATFETTPLPPTVEQLGVHYLTSSSAELLSWVNTNGGSTAVTFEYGLTTSYGSEATAWESPLATGGAYVHTQVSGLAGGTTYHFRVKATNAGGTTTSADEVFTTPPRPPGSATAVTLPATLISSTSATFNGMVNNNGNPAETAVVFEYGLTNRYSWNDTPSPFMVSGTSDTPVVRIVNDLTPNTIYHYRVRTDSGGSVIYGVDQVFTTPATGFPAASTAPATQVTNTQARLNGFVSANGGPPVTSMVFEYGPDTNYGSSLPFGDVTSSSNFVPVSDFIPVSGENVTYHYRLVATNANGTTTGQDVTFTTPDPHDPKLSGLALSSGSLQPGFSSVTTAYTTSVPYDDTSITLTPTAAQAGATIEVNGSAVSSGTASGPVALTIGDNTITIIVTAADGTTTQNYTMTVTRAAATAGSLDFSFNGAGKVTTALSPTGGYGYKVAIQPDGKIIVCGYATVAGNDDFALVRYLPDGTLDTTFNGTGMVTTAVGPGADYAANLALQSDGRIVVCGRTSNGNDDDFALVRYNGDGTLDPSFGSNGKSTLDFSTDEDVASSLAVLSDGKILVAGFATISAKRAFAVARCLANGTPDPDFGTNGRVTTSFGTFGPSYGDVGAGMTVQGDGSIVVVGTVTGYGDSNIGIARYTSSGSLDPTFNGTGKVSASISSNGDVGRTVIVQSDGKILVCGAAFYSNWDSALLRLNSDGTLDTDFGNGGKVVTDLTSGGDWANDMALQGDGRILVAGDTYGPYTFAMLRFMPDGSPDGSFGSGGRVSTPFGNIDEGGYGVALQSDGRIVAAGFSGDYNSYKFAVARYLGDGPAIAMRQTPGTNLFDGISTVNFGGRLPGTNISLSFDVRNPSLVDLTGLVATIDGANAGDFVVTTSPATTLASMQSTTFSVRFAPSSNGERTAVLHIASNVTGSNGTFDIALTGTGLLPVEDWRQTHFNTSGNTGAAADDADPNGNGICNLIEYALDGDPIGSTNGTGILPQASLGGGNEMRLVFTRHLDRAGITLTVQAADSLTGPWTGLAQSVNGASFLVLATGATVNETGSGNTRSVVVGDRYQITDPAHPRRFMRLEVTRQ